ncbi:uncharacterized protein A4U43_C05F35010 [Asparagus officinalis]|uniref:Exocyst subunit Exo70 family protein n=1 Tax=Asparagus officinalis TaxID=4686 RepID=A0A5P1EXJ1_ASPOF|nr:exocyst complex component EXO70B1-like [Asparagus officinalis]ONK70564.1 uncharacterized protein A4U43_C05F35010 [Asparagus officinalis]
MDRTQPPIPQKSNSFSASTTSYEEKICHRNLSLGAVQFEETLNKKGEEEDEIKKPDRIEEGEEQDEQHEENAEADIIEETVHSDNLASLMDNVGQFLTILLSLGEGAKVDDDDENASNVPEIPETTIEKFVALVEKEIIKYESGEEKLLLEKNEDEPSILGAVEVLSKLTNALSPFTSNPKYYEVMNMTGAILHHTMSFFEDEFYSLLDESSKSSKDQGGSISKTKRPPSFSRMSHDHERPVASPSSEPNPADFFPASETLARLQAIAHSMISAGYEAECRLVFAACRRNAFKASMSDSGFEKIAIDDVQRMGWESLEGEIAKWNKSFCQAITTTFSLEHDLCYSVFTGHEEIASDIFYNFTSSATHNLLNFPEAIAITKRSSEKLFKVLDMYETLKDMMPMVDRLFPREGKPEEEQKSEKKPEEDVKLEEEKEEKSEDKLEEEDKPEEKLVEEESSSDAASIKAAISGVKCRLGEAAVAILCELENSIKSHAVKNAVPGGAIHPLTSYIMNYLEYACEYINTLEQIFKDHRNSDDNDEEGKIEGSSKNNSNNSHGSSDHTPFEAQVTQMMELLQLNLESKAKLYKEVALNNIFLMNNGRYIVQRIRGSPEVNRLLGNTWCRKRSSDLRQYHKNYQRETWSKVLECFKDAGLTVKGSVHKPVLKERFKSFNALFDEIHKVQSTWVVPDEQLKSELRVSITAVIVPAYRSFLARYGQYLDAGRQTEKYVKFAPEEVETLIDDLFGGNANTTMRRK